MSDLNRDELERRHELENRDMDDTVVMGKSSRRVNVYHELGEDGEPLCGISLNPGREWMYPTRENAMRRFVGLCLNGDCPSDLPLHDDDD